MMSVSPRANADQVIAEAEADLARWAGRWPIFDPIRIPALARTIAAQLEPFPRPVRDTVGLVAFWIIAFDAAVDEGRRSEHEIARLVAQCRALAASRGAVPEDGDDPLSESWREIVLRVAQGASYPPFARLWRGAGRQMLDAIVAHRRLGQQVAAGKAPPGALAFSRVLALTSRSIGVRFYLLTAWVLADDPSLLARRAALLRAADAAARAIRLANDLQTWERDIREGNINTIWALERRSYWSHLPPERRRERALGAAARQLQAAAAAVSAAEAALSPESPIERGLRGLVAFVVDVYRRADYATYRVPERLDRPAIATRSQSAP